MNGAIHRVRALGVGLLGLVLAGPALSQRPPPPTPALGPPFGLPDSAPPPFSKGKGGKAGVDVSFSCLGVEEAARHAGSPLADIADELILQSRDSVVILGASASGDLVEGRQGAAARVETDVLTLQPFDICASSAGSVLDSVVTGTHSRDPEVAGVADVEFHFTYRATLELQEGKGSAGRFVAFSGTELEVLGVPVDSFQVTADGGVVDAPPGLTIVDASVGTRRRYEISGTYVVEGQLLYGPGVKNVVRTTFYAGGEVESLDRKGARIVAGFAGAETLDSVMYDIVSLDPAVSFTFVAGEQ